MRDERMCSGDFHERDGVHLKMKGYAHMWGKASAAAGLAVAAVETADAATRTGSISAPPKIERVPIPVPRKPFPVTADLR